MAATINAGTVEAAFRLKNEVSPTIKAVQKDMATLSPTVKAANDNVKKLEDGLGKTATKAGQFADSVGRTATTMARSASVFGLNANALRALDDAADIAELGFNNLSKSAAGFNAASLGVAGAGLAVGTAIGSWLNTFPAVRAAADALTGSLYRLFQSQEALDKQAAATQGLKAFSAEMAAAHKAAQEMQIAGAGGMEAWVKGAISARDNTKLLADASALVGRNIKDLDEAKAILKVEADTKKAADAQKKLAEETKRADEQLKQLALQYAELTREAEKYFESTEGGKLAEEGAGLLASQTIAASDAAQDLADGFGVVKVSAEDMAKAVSGVNDAIHDGELGIGKINAGLIQAADSGRSLGDSLRDAFAKLPEIILGALQGGGNLGKSIGGLFGSSIFGENSALVKNLTGGLTNVLGKTIGGALGSIIPGLGTLLGGALGGLMDKIGGLFGGEEKKVNDIRDAFFEAQGGFVELQKKLVGLTNQDLVKKIFDAKTVEQFNDAVSEVNALLGSQQEAQEALEAAIEKYGFSIEELGPKFQAQKLNEQALALFKDFQLLTASGIDVGTVLEKMGPELQDLVANARATGVALPEAMRPMIDALIQSGQLVDENGVAFESAEAAGLTFAQSLEEGIASAVEAINRLVAALTGIPAVNIPVNVTGVPTPTDAGGGEGERVPGHASGFYSSALPADYTFRAHQGEAVSVTPASETRMGGGGGGLSIESIVVQGSSNPEATAQAVVKAIRDNIAGLRTELAYANAGK